MLDPGGRTRLESLLLLVHAHTTGSDGDEEQETTHDRQGLEKVVLEEILLHVGVIDRPPVVDHNVEDGQEQDQEHGRPLGLESNSDHDTGGKANNRGNDARQRPRTVEGESNKQKDEKNSSSELEVGPLVVLSNRGQAGKELATLVQRVRHDHQETTNDREVAEEEAGVKDQSVAQCLCHDNTKEGGRGVFSVFPCDDQDGA